MKKFEKNIDLYSPQKLKELADLFYQDVNNRDPLLFNRFENYRSNPQSTSPVEISGILISMAEHLDNFIASLFKVETELDLLKQFINSEDDVLYFKKEFILRRALKKWDAVKVQTMNFDEVDILLKNTRNAAFNNLDWETDEEKATASMAKILVEIEKAYKQKIQLDDTQVAVAQKILKAVSSDNRFAKLITIYSTEAEKIFAAVTICLEKLEQWYAVVIYSPADKQRVKGWNSFRLPENIDYYNLVDYKVVKKGDGKLEIFLGDQDHYRRKNGFDLIDPRFSFCNVIIETDANCKQNNRHHFGFSYRQHQRTDAVHDERSLCAMSHQARRPCYRR
ncbi:MAG: hypothetical protein KKF98_12505 [Bacteroidetes bacterium]|nr:hypothetical protein [Bacteroidota bacterium]